jgi:stage II sporulation protein D
LEAAIHQAARARGIARPTVDRLTFLPPHPGQFGVLECRASRGRPVRFTTAELQRVLSGESLPSPMFTIEIGATKCRIEGRGHGHGVGLCQWGARGLALRGWSCERILQHYYPGATIAPPPGTGALAEHSEPAAAR